MRIMTYISYFSISLVLQVVWLLLIKDTPNIFLIDMITVSFLFTLFMFILDQIFKKKSGHIRGCFLIILGLLFRFEMIPDLGMLRRTVH